MTSAGNRILSVLLVVLLGIQMLWVSWEGRPAAEEIEEEKPIVIWYTDPEIQSYMEAAAQEFAVQHGLKVYTELVTEVDYIETICARSVAETMSGPDVYVASSALLEKATLAGLTTAIENAGASMETEYSPKAVQAVSYNGAIVGLPFYIETCFMLYNNYYVDPAENEIPHSIDDILAYAENFEADEVTGRVESIFKWNVADVIESYMCMGAYTDLGGPSGDDKTQVSMDLDQIRKCMEYYQSLNAFFAIDADTVTSEEIIRQFIDGKIVFAIANVPMLAELSRAVEAGEIPEYAASLTRTNEAGEEETTEISYDPFYNVAPLPALTDELDSRGLSVTNSVVVNPYSGSRDTALQCARYLTGKRTELLYAEAGKLPAYRNLPGELSDELNNVYQAYEIAAEVPKIMELSNIWLQLEVVLADIWRGADIEEALNGFSELLAAQLD